MVVMKVLIVHNMYGQISGEETVIENLAALLKKRGVSVCRFSRSSAEIADKLSGKAAAFFSGIHNPFAAKAFGEFLQSNRPDVVHIHNLYPLISPSILPVCKDFGVPVVMTVHNFRLACPNGLLLSHGEICHRCLGGREYWCVLRNCENDIFKSTGYALRTAVARMLRRFYDNVNHFICLSEFQKNILVSEGMPADRVSVLANPVSFAQVHKTKNNNTESPIGPFGDDIVAAGMSIHPPAIPPPTYAGQALKGGKNANGGGYVAYVGRVSREKGIATLFDAARLCSDIPFVVAGSWQAMPEARELAPSNVTLLGAVPSEKVGALYENARLFVLPSVGYEGFPTVLLEAMSHGLAVVCSRIGGLPEIVEDGVTGLLYEPGNVDELANRIKTLWQKPSLREKLGEAGRRKLNTKYNAEKLVNEIIGVYGKLARRRRSEG
jgi:glycosyltransferase involved in cell wall biosynthesis